MKPLLLIIAMLIACSCFGQKKDTLPVTKENGLTITGFLNDSTYSYSISRSGVGSSWGAATIKNGVGNENYNKPDTVKVIMLVCDTTPPKANFFIDGNNMISGRIGGGLVFLQFGYEVGEIYFTSVLETKMLRPKYLDQNKKPLPPSVIVWMTKEIKQ